MVKFRAISFSGRDGVGRMYVCIVIGRSARHPARFTDSAHFNIWALARSVASASAVLGHARDKPRNSRYKSTYYNVNKPLNATGVNILAYTVCRLMSTPRIESVLGGPHRLLGLRGCLCPFHRGGPRRLLHGAVSHWGPPAHRRAGPPARGAAAAAGIAGARAAARQLARGRG